MATPSILCSPPPPLPTDLPSVLYAWATGSLSCAPPAPTSIELFFYSVFGFLLSAGVAWIVVDHPIRRAIARDQERVNDGADRRTSEQLGGLPAALDGPNVAMLARSRRSIFPKDYTGESVSRVTLEHALRAANWAPTHGKTEPWRFVVFQGEGLAQLHALKLAATERSLKGSPEKLEAALAKLEKKKKELAKCSAIIGIVCKRQPNAKGNMMPEWEDVAACACAVQNMHLVLVADGAAGYWSTGGCSEGGWAEDAEVRALLGAEEGQGAAKGCRDKVLGWFHVGMTDKASAYKAKRGPVEEKVKWLGAAADGRS